MSPAHSAYDVASGSRRETPQRLRHVVGLGKSFGTLIAVAALVAITAAIAVIDGGTAASATQPQSAPNAQLPARLVASPMHARYAASATSTVLIAIGIALAAATLAGVLLLLGRRTTPHDGTE